MPENNSLAHTTWNCKYHIVFAPKFRRKIFYGTQKVEIGAILRQLCEWKQIKIIEAEVCPDHIHMLVEIPPKTSVASFVGYLKGKSRLRIRHSIPETESNEPHETHPVIDLVLCLVVRKVEEPSQHKNFK